MSDSPPLIIAYTDLLHAHGGPEAPEAKAFLAQRQDDPKFQERAETLNRLWLLKATRDL